MSTLLEALAAHALELRPEQLPEATRERAKLLLLDTLGLMIAGADTDAARLARAHLKGEFGPAHLLPFPDRVGVAEAAWFGGITSFAYNFADTSLDSVSHSGTVAIPALLALAGERRVTGLQAIVCVVLGYDLIETAARLMSQLGGRMAAQRRGFRPTPVCGPLGAAGIAARLRGLDSRRTVCALGLAAHLGAGLRGGGPRLYREEDGRPSMMWFHSGFAARHGIEAVRLAELGAIEQPTLLEADGGFLQAHAGLETAPEGVALPFPLGREFAVMAVAPKLFCCAHTLAPAAEALLALKERERFEPDDVEAISVEAPAPHLAIARGVESRPPDAMAAQLSYPFVLATCLVHDGFLPRALSRDGLGDARVLRVADRVRVTEDPELTRRFGAGEGWPARVTVRLASGAELSELVPVPEGAPGRPVSRGRLEDKFRALASTRLAPAQVDAVRGLVGRLEAVDDVREVLEEIHS